MSDFPKGGDVKVTRAWLDKEGFVDVFNGNLWKADALLGKDDEFIKRNFLRQKKVKNERKYCVVY